LIEPGAFEAGPSVQPQENMKEKLKHEHVAAALRQSAGIVSAAAQVLEAAYGSCTPMTVRNYLSRHPSLKKVLDETIELNLDLAESQLLKAVRTGDDWAVRFFLETKGKHRGYTRKMEHGGEGGGPVIIRIEGADARL
jgi:hypothetical protein